MFAISIATRGVFPTNCSTDPSQKRLGFHNFKSLRVRSQFVSKRFAETFAISRLQIDTCSAQICQATFRRLDCISTVPNRYFLRPQFVITCFEGTLAFWQFQIDTFLAPICTQAIRSNACNFTFPNLYVLSTNSLTTSLRQRLHFHNFKSIRFPHANLWTEFVANIVANSQSPNRFISPNNCITIVLSAHLRFSNSQVETVFTHYWPTS